MEEIEEEKEVDFEPFFVEVEMFLTHIKISGFELRNEKHLELLSSRISKSQNAMNTRLNDPSRDRLKFFVDLDSSRVYFSFDHFVYSEVSFQNGSIKVKLVGTFVLAAGLYQGIAAYSDFKTSVRELQADAEWAVDYIQEQFASYVRVSLAQNGGGEPIEYLAEVDLWLRNEKEIELMLLEAFLQNKPSYQ